MDLIVILILCILATTKVTLQGFFAKKNVVTFSDGVFFNGLIFFFSALLLLKNAMDFKNGVILFGGLFGILTVLFQLCYIKAMSYGNVSLTVLAVNLSMMIPLTVSVFFYNEPMGGLRFVGILLTIVSLTLNVDKKEKSTAFKKWLFLSLLASLSNGGCAVCQQIFGKTEWKNETQGFVAWSYIIATVLSMLLYLVLRAKGRTITFKVKPSVFGISLAVGVVLGVFQFINTKAIACIDGTLLFPAYNGGTLILSSISSILFLKDRLTNRQKISVFIGIISIVLMNV